MVSLREILSTSTSETLKSQKPAHVFSSPTLVVAVALMLITAAMILRVALDPTLETPPRIGSLLNPNFSLIDQNGNPITNAAFEGKPRLLVFGYTSCPDICPTILSALAENATELGADAGKLTWVFITVDPEHDTPAHLKSYLAAFSPRFIGLTGKPSIVSTALDKYHVFRDRRARADGSYSIDHTSSVFLISADGHLQGTIKEDKLGTREALMKIRHLISS
ncbi:SCO family protein [Hyphomicrobium sp.]|jgi:protein SCO1/2|uniref:SCO family protein n=1 Tax=Hyphomicrobium sp. TaxID=82 RepID=UPI002C1BDB9C|nr:SCO family protein [Hyphomicrobium sp.]HVZ04835.1 SCO family protein [Hyphomicrobium sp.]